jgi:glucose/arabinose dehydrogenase
MLPSTLDLRRICAVLLVAGVLIAGVERAAAATLPAGFTETRVATGISAPTAMAFAPDARLFVCEQGGRLRVIKNGALLSAPFLTVTVSSAGERGLLGVAFDPNFASNHFVYVYYTATTPTIHNRVSRFTANGDVAVAGSELVLLNLNDLSGATNHNGGAMHFGPDGKLYVAVGENANGSNSQTLANLLGKILRLNADGTIPTDNPFFSTATGVNRAIWSMGLRNPFTFAFQRGSGRMFINDVGEVTFEEINDGVAGSNYGWPTTEGTTTDPRFRSPLFTYRHGTGPTVGCAITGGAFYNPVTPQFPASFVGRFFFADFCGGWIRTFDAATGTAADFASGIGSPVDLQLADDGTLYYLARDGGSVFRVQASDNAAPTISVQPADQRVAAGQSATFSVAASGVAPLRYQWERNGMSVAGATSATLTLASTTLADNGATFRVVVTNDFGSVTSDSATLTVLANDPPTAIITSPANQTLYAAGDTLTFTGMGTDAEDGTLPAAAFTWQIDFHHADHLHPFLAPTSGIASGTFTIPTTGETATNVFFRVILTVRDSAGLTSTTFVDVVPRTANLTLTSAPSGLQVTLDGQPVTTPVSVSSVVGMTRRLGVVSPQTSGGTTYTFQSWSDGGAAGHDISTPATDATFSATFVPATGTTGTGIGLAGTYWDNIAFTGTSVVRIDPTVNFDFGVGAPVAGFGVDTFSARWTGQIQPKVTGTHTFFTRSDDGVRLFVNGQQVINNWTDHAVTENSGTIALVAGQKYDIRMEFYENGGQALAQLFWSAPGLAREVVPVTQLYPYALLAVGSTTLNSGDAAVRARLEAGGFVPVLRTATAATTADAAGKGLVVISSTLTSTDVNTKFRTVINPVLNWEANLSDDLGMTALTAGTDYGTLASQTQVTIVNAAHPLAAGLSGTVAVTSSANTITWGRPNANAVVVARPIGDNTRAVLFGYERGAAMPGLVAPGRRVGFFLENTTAAVATPQGIALLDAALRWASGR